jgi:Asp-tRNA(Asn)/Glu-tRNA(Gln) amidotransferase A subunit family amidase
VGAPVWLARAAEAGPAGRRLAVKDLLDTHDLPTTYGSPAWEGHRPVRDAWAVAVLRDAGWHVAGKVGLHELAYGTTGINRHFGTIETPLAPGRLAGGSSSGSAAVVALGEADAALGTDTGGSIRIPAACCGVAGFKPTYGLVSTDGVFPLAPSLDHVGPLARDVATLRAVQAELAPLAEAPAGEPRLGVAWLHRTSEGIAEAIRAFGARPVDFPEPEDLPVLDVLWYEAALTHRHADISRYGEDLQRKLGGAPPRERWVAARRELAAARRRLAALWEEVDVLLVPTLPFVAPLVETTEWEGRPINEVLGSLTRPFNGLGWPACAVPTAPAEEGLPGSVQVVGPPGADALVLAVAESLQA